MTMKNLLLPGQKYSRNNESRAAWRDYDQLQTAVGVSGTHGKTTTTSMLTEILVNGSLDPTVSVGGILPSIHGNLRIGHSDNL